MIERRRCRRVGVVAWCFASWGSPAFGAEPGAESTPPAAAEESPPTPPVDGAPSAPEARDETGAPESAEAPSTTAAEPAAPAKRDDSGKSKTARSATSSAGAEVEVLSDDAASSGALTPRRVRAGAFAGLRTLFVLGGGYEPYAERALLWSLSLGGNLVLSHEGPLALALGLNWDAGASNSDARGGDTEIAVHRLTLVPEARYALGGRVVAFGRVGVGAAYLGASIEDRVLGTDREAEQWVVTADPGVGVALRLGGRRSREPSPGFWLILDGGYVFSTPADLAFTSEDAPARSAPLRLEELSLHGPYARLSASLGF